MLKLETDRLYIIPLDLENFKLFIEDREKMEENLGLQITKKKLSHEMKEIFNKPYQKALADEENILWYTNWQIVLKKENIIVGGFTFKNPPDEEGVIEVGYGIEKEYQNNAYMSEALEKMLNWASREKEVKKIIAETNKDNKASQRVLEKSGMIRYKETKDSYWYQLITGGQ